MRKRKNQRKTGEGSGAQLGNCATGTRSFEDLSAPHLSNKRKRWLRAQKGCDVQELETAPETPNLPPLIHRLVIGAKENLEFY